MLIKNIGKIESYDTYIDIAFRNGSKAREEKKVKVRGIIEGADRDRKGRERRKKVNSKEENRLKKHMFLETERINTINKSLISILGNISTKFPNIDTIHELYREIIAIHFEPGEIKKALGAVLWAKGALESLHVKYSDNIKNARDADNANLISKSYMGRVNSIMKRIDKDLTNLEKFRKFDRWLPPVKTSMFTMCISGFPNVGKSTLLSNITTARPEIDSYPFTTRRLNLGYIGNEIQLIDTPGTLARFEKMNDIEKLAHLAMKLVGDAIIYVYDPTLEYPWEDQNKLAIQLKEHNLPIIYYLSKTDLVSESEVEKIKKEISGIITSKEELIVKIEEIKEKEDRSGELK